MQIFVKTVNDRTFRLEVEPYDRIYKVKGIIRARENLRRGKQRLLFGGILLRSERRLIDYNIQQDYTIHLAIRQR